MREEIHKYGYSRKAIPELLLFSALALTLLVLSCSARHEYPEPPLKGSEVVIDAAQLHTGEPLFYTLHDVDGKINFFVVRTDDKILSFLDACARCYPKKLGYRFEDGHFFCRACGLKYSLSDIEKGFGSCFPIRLDGHLLNGKYVIPVSLLREHAHKF